MQMVRTFMHVDMQICTREVGCKCDVQMHEYDAYGYIVRIDLCQQKKKSNGFCTKVTKVIMIQH